jgi:hypothetical protein
MKTHLVPLFTQLLSSTTVGVLAGISILGCLLPKPTLAQTATTQQPLVDFNNQESQDLFSGKNNGNSFGVFDLINRAQLGTTRDLNDYTNDQRENLNDAAAKFRLQQLQRLRNPASPPGN